MKFVDTNIFIRLLTNDDPEKAKRCEELFKAAKKNEEELYTSELVIAEIVWVLESYYDLPKGEVKEKVEKILNTHNLFCPNKDILYESLMNYFLKNIDFIDALMKRKNILKIFLYDSDFDKISSLKRI
ncbi:MAG: PIN domain-containing protein [bacterium]